VRLNADGTLDVVLGAETGGSEEIYALGVQPDGGMLVGGGFTSIGGVARRNLARFHVNGTLDTTFNPSHAIRDDIDELAVQADGRIFFRERNGRRLLRLNANGTVDVTFAPGTPETPATLISALDTNGRLVLAGTFTEINGTARRGLARLLGDGSLDPNFDPAPPDTVPNAMIVDTLGRTVIVGPFTSVGAVPRAGLARFSPTGEVDPNLKALFNPGASLKAVAPLPDGRIVVAGSFSTVDGAPRGGLAAFMPDGSLDSSFGVATSINGPVARLVPRKIGGVFIAGSFTSVAGQRRNNLAALASDGSLDVTFAPIELTNAETVQDMVEMPDGGVVIAAEYFAPSRLRRLRRLTVNGAIDPSFVFPYSVDAIFDALAVDPAGRILAGYRVNKLPFSTTTRPILQRFLANGSVDRSFDIGMGPSTMSNIIVDPEGRILITGLTTFDDLPVGGVVRLQTSSPLPNAALANISTRAVAGANDNTLIAGFVIGGSAPKTVLVRAVGPGLIPYGVAGVHPNPGVSVFDGTSRQIDYNDDWARFNAQVGGLETQGHDIALTAERVGAFPLVSKDAALLLTLAPGNYTAQVGRSIEGSGVALIEIYDVNTTPADRRLLNISSRGLTGPGEATMIAGFIIPGSTPRRVLLRAAGPALAEFSVNGRLADPVLVLANSSGATLASNDDWSAGTDAAEIALVAARVGAFSFASGSKDSALVTTLPPGLYSALVNGASGTSGVALVEVYEVP
jgi:uncharacterized delta-60 repeat protein